MDDAATCIGQTKFKPSPHGSRHTVTCQLPAGHDGLHSWSKDSRTVMWGGDAKRAEDDTRLRFGRWLGES